ncbi:MAG TPA: PASTA domain-containing protein [Solirubrobacterales bacterium]|nr:PASTA domain-containing protein [Solirubrobacterales bacterium]
MHPSRVLSALIATALVSLGLSASASAVVTVGSPLQGLAASSQCGGSPCTLIQTGLTEPGATAVAPISGVVVRWHMLGGSPLFGYRLRVLSRGGGPSFTGTGSSAAAFPTGPGVQTFSTSIPIQAGQYVGIDLPKGAPLTYGNIPGTSYEGVAPSVPDGVTGLSFPGSSSFELGYNAEILPPPVATGISPGVGSVKGGTAVTIVGANLAELRGVSFGGIPAGSFTASAESVMTAVAPPSVKIGAVPVTVTTVAGSATAPAPFLYQGCKVPKLSGKKLKGAKKRIRNAGCKVGKVRRQKGVSAKTGVVVKQSPKAGGVLAPGAKVSVKLGA